MNHKNLHKNILKTIVCLFLVLPFLSAFSGAGNGSSINPFQITNCTQLQEMNSNLSKDYLIMNEINCSDTVNWNGGKGFLPIGNQTNETVGFYDFSANFSGNLNGQYHTISNLYINRSSTILNGLIAYSNTAPSNTLKNINLLNISITGGNYTGGLIGAGDVNIINCSVSGIVNGGNFLTGGIIGYGVVTYIENSSYFGIVTGNAGVGGLVGEQDTPSIINNSYSSANVSGKSDIGGIAGVNFGINSIIKNTNAFGNVIGLNKTNYENMGGIVGTNTGTITNSFFTGNIYLYYVYNNFPVITLQNNWVANPSIINGLPTGFTGDFYNTPDVFYKDSSWYMIKGVGDGYWRGFVWNGTGWKTNSTIVSGLTNVSFQPAPTVFFKDNNWYLISGNYLGKFYGFSWNGTKWLQNSSVNASLPDIGDISTPSVFYKDSSWYLISGANNGFFYGFVWNGTDWKSNSTVNNSLGVGSQSTPSVFYKDSSWYIISGSNAGLRGFAWNTTTLAWATNSTIISGIPALAGIRISPTVFQKDGALYLIAGQTFPASYGYSYSRLNQTLNSPSHNSFSSANVTFNCSVSSSLNLTHTTFLLYNRTSHNLIYNETKYINGFSATTLFTYNFLDSDDYSWNCLSYDTITATANPTNFTLNVNVRLPNITLQNPVDNSWIHNKNVFFIFTPSDVWLHNISTCELWGNFTGSWDKNYTWSNPLSGNITFINFDLLDNYYSWNVWCNDSLNNGAFSPSNFTFGLDTIFPSNFILNISTSTGSQEFSFNSTANDNSNNYTCKYSVYNLAGGIDGASSNISYICNNQVSANVSSFAGYILKTVVTDIAGNENATNKSFTVTSGGSHSTGGTPPPASTGNPVINSNKPVLTEGNWTMETELGGNNYGFSMIQNSNRTRDMLFENLGVNDRTITMSCVEVNGTVNLCDGITFEQDTFPLPVQKSIKTSNKFTLAIPSDLVKGTYIVNLVGTDESGNVGVITLNVKITTGFSITGAITKLFSDTNGGIPYVLFFFIVVFIFGVLSNLIIFKPLKLPSALSVLVGLFFGIIFLLLPI